jgi:hypothetical protein
MSNSGVWMKLDNQNGKISFFGIVIVVILVIAAAILFMVLSEVLQKEEATLAIQVKTDADKAASGATISINDKSIGYTDSNGTYSYSYPVDKQGTRLKIKAEYSDYEAAETNVSLTGKPGLTTLTVQRPFASLIVTVMDSLTQNPMAGVDISIGDDYIGTTAADGKLTVPSYKLRMHDSPSVKIEKKATKYTPKTTTVFIDSKVQAVTVYLSEQVKAIVAPVQKPEPKIIHFAMTPKAAPRERAPQPTSTPPSNNPPPPADGSEKPTDMESLPSATLARGDSAFMLMSNRQYRQALNIYNDFTSQIRFQARPDFFYYGADCALHLAGDENGIFNEVMLDSALTYLDQAERYQNLVEDDIFPALVQLKKGMAWAYKCDAPSSRNTARLRENRQKALFYLRSAISIMKNKNIMDNEFYTFAVQKRTEIENR